MPVPKDGDQLQDSGDNRYNDNDGDITLTTQYVLRGDFPTKMPINHIRN